jgi:hypothetical protein
VPNVEHLAQLLREVTDAYNQALAEDKAAMLDALDTAAAVEERAHEFKEQIIRDWYRIPVEHRAATGAEIARAARLSQTMVYRIARQGKKG